MRRQSFFCGELGILNPEVRMCAIIGNFLYSGRELLCFSLDSLNGCHFAFGENE